MRYRLDVAFHGREFHGWQRQPNLRTVQGELEMWLSRLLQGDTAISLIGAGRTDAGVHAQLLASHFDWSESLDTAHLRDRLRVAIPSDLKILRFHRVSGDFHSRNSATARVYTYRMRVGSWPFGRDREWQLHGALNPAVLHDCARLVLGPHDFSGFCRALSLRDNNRCTVMNSNWEIDGDCCIYTIRADHFVHEMIRLIVGTSVAAARGRWTSDWIREILQSGDVRLCGDAAPPHGLTLEAVEYPPGVGEPIDSD